MVFTMQLINLIICSNPIAIWMITLYVLLKITAMDVLVSKQNRVTIWTIIQGSKA